MVTLGYQHLAGKVDLADSWARKIQTPRTSAWSMNLRFLVNALQIAQVLNLNFGGNFHELTLAATNKIAHCGTAPL